MSSEFPDLALCLLTLATHCGLSLTSLSCCPSSSLADIFMKETKAELDSGARGCAYKDGQRVKQGSTDGWKSKHKWICDPLACHRLTTRLSIIFGTTAPDVLWLQSLNLLMETAQGTFACSLPPSSFCTDITTSSKDIGLLSKTASCLCSQLPLPPSASAENTTLNDNYMFIIHLSGWTVYSQRGRTANTS